MRYLIPLLLYVPAAPAADSDPRASALAAARAREGRLKQLTVSWTAKAFVPKGGRMDADPVGLPLPRVDVSAESAHRLVLDGIRYRVEHDDPGLRQHVPGEVDGVTAYDGATRYSRMYLQGRDQAATLTLEHSQDPDAFGTGRHRSVVLWCRGSRLEPYGAREQGPRPAVRTDLGPDGMVTVRFASPAGSSTTYSLDPRRDYLVRRVRSEAGDTVEVTDVEYREQPGLMWVPDRWTTVKTRAGGKVVERVEGVVDAVRVGEPGAADAFQLRPLPGETVYDHDTRKSRRVQADGSPEELDPTGAPPPEPPARPAPAWPGRTLVRFVLLPALLVAVLAAVVLRRRRPPHTPSP